PTGPERGNVSDRSDSAIAPARRPARPGGEFQRCPDRHGFDGRSTGVRLRRSRGACAARLAAAFAGGGALCCAGRLSGPPSPAGRNAPLKFHASQEGSSSGVIAIEPSAPGEKSLSERVVALLRELASELHPEHPGIDALDANASIERDFGLDSLARGELAQRLEKELGI